MLGSTSPGFGPAGPFSVHRAAEAAPHCVSVVEGERAWTFGELAQLVAGMQLRLRSRGLAVGTRVAVVAYPDLASVVAASACLEEGLVPCFLHPRLPPAARAENQTRVQAQDTLELPEDLAGLAAEPPPHRAERSEGEDFAIFFTSGSSGVPKGVRLSRRAFYASAVGSAHNLGWYGSDRWLLNLPVAHIGGFSVLTRTRLAGRALVLPEPGSRSGFEPEGFVRALTDRQVTLVSLVPTMLGRILDAGLRSPPAVRAVLVGGAWAGAAQLRRARSLGWPVLTTYGLTEACSQVTTQVPGGAVAAGSGRPLAGTEVRISEGRILVRGPTLLTGYLPARPALDEEGWFSTGDLGAIDGSGQLHVLGRADEVIISGGENVSPARVEGVLRGYPGIEEVVVYGVEHAEWGQAVAATVLVKARAIERSGLKGWISQRLASFERPKFLAIETELPLLANGKIDRRTVRQRASEQPLIPL